MKCLEEDYKRNHNKRNTPKPVNYFDMKIDHIDIVTSRQNENRPY